MRVLTRCFGGMTLDQVIRRALDLAIDNVPEGGAPSAAVLVKDGKIIADGVNELHKKYDVSGHAELLAIRKAQQKLQTHDLSGYTMYASGEPCPMCLTSMYFSGITDVYYCASVEDAVEAGLGKSKAIYEDLKKPNELRSLKMKHMPLEESQDNPMMLWKERNDNG